ncbi:MAG: adhesin (plasmid) [Spiroplasma poulsonii]|nr:adhesin [Spiroplasma poulsonii]
MKKLLSILTISTLTASVPAPLLANTTLERVKRNVSTLTSNSNNDYLPLKEINNIGNNIYFFSIDSKDNLYFGTTSGAYVLKQGSTKSEPINGIIGTVYSLAIDSSNNIYFISANNKKLYVLKQGSTKSEPINGISGPVYSLAVDSSNNIYFFVAVDGVFVLKHGETNPTKINGISGQINSLAVDSKDNIYFGTNDGAYVLEQGSTKSEPINDISGPVYSLAIDSFNNIYFGTTSGAFVLKQNAIEPTPIDGISGQINSLAVDSKDNIYFGTTSGAFVLQTAFSWVKTQNKFTLVDSSKTKTWTRPNLLSVDGEVNIDIANPNINKVMFDNVQQGQTNKQWKINVKPETAPRDHNLQVMFTLDGKQYTSEITVSMQAKIDPPTPPVQQNLSDLVKTTDLGNIIDNNDNTIFTAVNQKNGNVIDDFSQITIDKKDNNKATLKARDDSKSYKGSVDVTYNVVPATVVDLKIDVTPSAPDATVIKNYLGQIDTSNLTNPVNTFSYANSESVITMVKPTPSSVITGVVYGCDEQWNKTSQTSTIDPTSGIKLDGSQLATTNGKYVVELADNLGHTNNVYLQIAKDKKIANYFDTDKGKQFEIWAKANGHDNIRGYGASQLNILFEESKNWQQLASDSQFATAVADWFKTNGKLVSKEPLTKEQVVEQLKKQIPSDITIPAVNTSNYDVNKVSFQLNQTEFNPNDKVNITVKYNSAISEQFTLQIKDSNAPNKKGGLTGLAIVGIVVGSLAGLVLLGWLFKKFVVDRFILGPIRDKKQKAWRIREDKALAEIEAEEEAEKAKRGK